MASKRTVSIDGGGFFGLLTILFVALKLTGVIDWSWWWVLAPLWGSFAIGVVILIGWLIYLAVSD